MKFFILINSIIFGSKLEMNIFKLLKYNNYNGFNKKTNIFLNNKNFRNFSVFSQNPNDTHIKSKTLLEKAINEDSSNFSYKKTSALFLSELENSVTQKKNECDWFINKWSNLKSKSNRVIDNDFKMKIINTCPDFIKCNDFSDPLLVKSAIRNGCNFSLLPKNFADKNDRLHGLLSNGSNIQYIDSPTIEEQIISLLNDPTAIKHIKNPSKLVMDFSEKLQNNQQNYKPIENSSKESINDIFKLSIMVICGVILLIFDEYTRNLGIALIVILFFCLF